MWPTALFERRIWKRNSDWRLGTGDRGLRTRSRSPNPQFLCPKGAMTMQVVLRRVALSIPILLLVSIMVFALIHLIPGDPVTVMLGQEATPEVKQALRHELGLDRPLVVQYFVWLGRVVRGDLGRSLSDRTNVLDQIRLRLPATIELAIG